MDRIRWESEALQTARAALRQRQYELQDTIADLRQALQQAGRCLPPGMSITGRIRSHLRKAEALQDELESLRRKLERVEACFEAAERGLLQGVQAVPHQVEDETHRPAGRVADRLRQPPFERRPGGYVPPHSRVTPPTNALIRGAEQARRVLEGKTLVRAALQGEGRSPTMPELVLPDWLKGRI